MQAILYIFLFFALTLLQVSFFPHFFTIPFLNFVLIGIISINIFEKRKSGNGLVAAIFAGFFLDVFSQNFFGFWMLISITTVIFIKFIVKTNFSWKNI